jgi:hypothetical protein
MTEPSESPQPQEHSGSAAATGRDLADVPAVEVVSTTALHLMSAAAVQLGLARTCPSTATSTRPAR